MDINTSFTSYLNNETNFNLNQYIEDVYAALDKIFIDDYYNLDYSDFNEDIIKAYNNQIPVNTVAADIAVYIDEYLNQMKDNEQSYNYYYDYEPLDTIEPEYKIYYEQTFHKNV